MSQSTSSPMMSSPDSMTVVTPPPGLEQVHLAPQMLQPLIFPTLPYIISRYPLLCPIQNIPLFVVHAKLFHYSHTAKTLVPHNCLCSHEEVRETDLNPLFSFKTSNQRVIVAQNRVTRRTETYVYCKSTNSLVQVSIPQIPSSRVPMPFFMVSDMGHYICREGDFLWSKKVQTPSGALAVLPAQRVRTFEVQEMEEGQENSGTLPQYAIKYCAHGHCEFVSFLDLASWRVWNQTFNMGSGEFEVLECGVC